MKDEQVVDVYRLKFGFRTISYSSDQLFINGRAFYCHGFGMHEDFEVFTKMIFDSHRRFMIFEIFLVAWPWL